MRFVTFTCEVVNKWILAPLPLTLEWVKLMRYCSVSAICTQLIFTINTVMIVHDFILIKHSRIRLCCKMLHWWGCMHTFTFLLLCQRCRVYWECAAWHIIHHLASHIFFTLEHVVGRNDLTTSQSSHSKSNQVCFRSKAWRKSPAVRLL